MKIYYIILLTIFLAIESVASTKKNIIQNLSKIDSLTFNFEQNINGKVENGDCIIKYPKKIFCKYKLHNKKILVSNGRSIVIKTISSYYIYPIEKTPLNIILNKEFLLEKIKNLNETILDNKFVNYKFFVNENEVNIFFNKDTYNLIGWQTVDIYQNLSITYISSIVKNQKVKDGLFKLPKQN